ncbi:MAG: N-acetylmuramoyl-L-alanine amidase [Clostridia bacterium]|nr:N-acetylmuramoyl-L-alanine amidase [Clostridia bacterium]
MKIFLIAGHGAGDSGATGNGYQEADLTREVVRNIPKYLEEYANVVIGDINRDWFTWLKTNAFNFQPYDYVLEVHFNSGANDLRGDGKITGSEIYVTTSETQFTVEENILKEMQKLGFTNRGVKQKNFSVISKVKAQGVSSALLEVAFVDDKDDMNLYEKEKDPVVRAISNGIATGFGLKESEELTLTQYEELSNRIGELERKAEDTEMIYNYIDENMPAWARETIRKLVDKGLLNGNEDGELELNDEMLRMFVVNDRAGLYGD